MGQATIANNAVAAWLSVERPEARTGGLPNDGGVTSLQTIIQDNGFARVKSLGIPAIKSSIAKSIVLTNIYALNTDPTSGKLSFTPGWSSISTLLYRVYPEVQVRKAIMEVSFMGQQIGQGEVSLSANARTFPITGTYSYYITVDGNQLYLTNAFTVFVENADSNLGWEEYLKTADKLQLTGALPTQEISADNFIATLNSSLVARLANTAKDPSEQYLTAIASRQYDGSFTGSSGFGFSISSPTSARR